MRDADPTREEIEALERRRLRSLVEVDIEVARTLHSPDYQLITPGGVTYSRDEYLGAIEAGEIDYSVFEPEAGTDVAIRVFSGGAAVRYVARIVISFPGGTDDGRFRHTDLWERGDDGWQATWSQATEIPRPRSAPPKD